MSKRPQRKPPIWCVDRIHELTWAAGKEGPHDPAIAAICAIERSNRLQQLYKDKPGEKGGLHLPSELRSLPVGHTGCIDFLPRQSCSDCADPATMATPSTTKSGLDSNAPATNSTDPSPLNYDALMLVFSLFVPPLSNQDARDYQLSQDGARQLSRLARVCKGFHEPALDCLWSNLPGLKPLLDCHPALKIVDGIYVSGTIPPDVS